MNGFGTLFGQAETILFLAQLGFLFVSMMASAFGDSRKTGRGRTIGVAKVAAAVLALATVLA
jgi:hypothetical protein